MPTKPRTLPDHLTTALIYTRVSTEEQSREGVSLDAQLTECQRYAVQQGWIVGQEYQDVLSGKRDDRPAYQALLAEVRRLRTAGQSVAVVVFRLDRLGRRIAERVRCWEEMKDLGVPVHSVREGGAIPELVANVLASVAQEEIRVLGERVAVAKRHITDNGWFITGQSPWGYRMRPATDEERALGAPATVMEPNPTEVPFVQEAFRRASEGQTIHAVHRWAVTLPEEARGGRKLAFATVRNVLISPIYIARHVYGDEDVLKRRKTQWEPLVDDATWQRIHDYIAGHKRLPRQASQAYLLTGLLRCPICGSRMTGRARSGRSRSYRCSGKWLGVDAPNPGCEWAALVEPVEQAVLAEILPLVTSAVSEIAGVRMALERAWGALREPATLQDELKERQRQQLIREVERARTRLTKAAVMLVDEDIDKEAYDLVREEAQRDLNAATTELERISAVPKTIDLPPLEVVLSDMHDWRSAFSDGDVAAQRQVLSSLIERITPSRIGWGKYNVSIMWTPLGEAMRTTLCLLPTAIDEVAAQLQPLTSVSVGVPPCSHRSSQQVDELLPMAHCQQTRLLYPLLA